MLDAIDSHHRVGDVDRNPVQRADFLERIIPERVGLKNLLVVTKVEKFVFHPFAHLFLGLASLSFGWIALFEV